MHYGLSDLANIVRKDSHPLSGASSDYDPLIHRAGDATFVLLGEASHGTHEFYRERAQITKRLIEEKRFTAVAVEADWPDSYRPKIGRRQPTLLRRVALVDGGPKWSGRGSITISDLSARPGCWAIPQDEAELRL
jgi:erythromycin esterase-like protein